MFVPKILLVHKPVYAGIFKNITVKVIVSPVKSTI